MNAIAQYVGYAPVPAGVPVLGGVDETDVSDPAILPELRTTCQVK